MTRRREGVAALVEGARAGNARSVARLISLVEDDGPALREVAAALTPGGSRARVIGLTGSPGVGKSTMVAALVRLLRARGERVGVLAVDPTSPFSGGALLGDRVRLGEIAADEGVYVRSMATRGQLGGLARATPQAVRVLEAAGCDVVLVETVGVGQSELEIAALADTTVVLLAPGMGDGVQAAKSGVLEIADVFVVNKADRDGARQTAQDLRAAQSLAARTSDWRPPICRTVAAREADNGLDELLAALEAHAQWLATSGEGTRRRTERAGREVEEIVLAQLRRRLGDVRGSALQDLASAVATGDLDPYRAADRLLDEL